MPEKPTDELLEVSMRQKKRSILIIGPDLSRNLSHTIRKYAIIKI